VTQIRPWDILFPLGVCPWCFPRLSSPLFFPRDSTLSFVLDLHTFAWLSFSWLAFLLPHFGRPLEFPSDACCVYGRCSRQHELFQPWCALHRSLTVLFWLQIVHRTVALVFWHVWPQLSVYILDHVFDAPQQQYGAISLQQRTVVFARLENRNAASLLAYSLVSSLTNGQVCQPHDADVVPLPKQPYGTTWQLVRPQCFFDWLTIYDLFNCLLCDMCVCTSWRR